MLAMRFILSTLSAGVMAMSAGTVYGQDYPNKPIRMVSSEPGGGNDFVARIIAPALAASAGWQVVVDNRGSITGMETAAKAPPDGYTVLVVGNDFLLLPLIQNVSFHPVRDFSPVCLVSRTPSILVVHPSVAVNSVADLIAMARAKPGALNYASGPTGAATHVAGELFKLAAGVNIVRVPYKGSGPALNDLIGGHVQLMFAISGAVAPHIKSGRLRALAITSAEPSALLPGLPTVAASGVPGYEAVAMFSIFAPAGTPATRINQLNREIVRTLDRPEVKEKFSSVGSETVGGPPDRLASTVKFEMARLGKMIKESGIKAD